MDKRAYRAAVRARIAALDAGYAASSDEAITARLLSLPEYTAAPTLFIYASVGREVSTWAIIRAAVGSGKRVCLPRTRGGGEMDFADISGGTQPARFGIPEPEASLPAAEPAEGDIVVVPALCCAPDGRRQGQGGGYYDRFLARYPGVTSACLAREALLDENLPEAWNDVRPGYVITEARIIKSEPRPAVRIGEAAGRWDTARALIREYTDSLGRDIGFQRPEEELAGIERIYGPPGGALVIAARGHEALGMAALRRLTDARCEMKRLYVRPGSRGIGLGEALAREIIRRAKALGYSELVLDTLEDMRAARALYARLGFAECEPYYANPIPGTSYMRLELK